MKRSLLFAFIINILVGCTNEPVPPIPEEDAFITISTSSPTLNVDTRGVGGLENEWRNNSIYIYALDKEATNLTIANYIINNERATATSSNTTRLTWNGGEKKYPESGSYDFYGYHIDDAIAGSINHQAYSISRSVQFDGTQDILISKAVINPSIISSTPQLVRDRAFSAYSARRGVQPYMEFEHLLAKLNFYIVAGQGSSAANVSIDAIEVESYDTGELIIVALGNTARGLTINTSRTKVFLNLKERAGNGTMQTLTPGIYKTNGSIPVEVGKGLLVAPDASYRVRIHMSQEFDGIKATEIYATTINYSQQMTTPTFVAGYEYAITLTVYGMERVDITAKLVNWENGGDVSLDPEIDY